MRKYNHFFVIKKRQVENLLFFIFIFTGDPLPEVYHRVIMGAAGPAGGRVFIYLIVMYICCNKK